MSFFKRSGTYNLNCFGKVGYKNDVKIANKCGNTLFMQASDCVINYLNKFFVALPTICDTFFCTLIPSKNAVFICLGEISFLSYKVGKLIFSPGCV